MWKSLSPLLWSAWGGHRAHAAPPQRRANELPSLEAHLVRLVHTLWTVPRTVWPAPRKKERDQLRVRYYGEIGLNGLGRMTKLTVRALVEAGVRVQFCPCRADKFSAVRADADDALLASLAVRHDSPAPYDVLVVQTIPPEWPGLVDVARRYARHPFTSYGIAIWETDAVPETWPAALRGVDVVSVPSEFNRAVVQAAVPERRVVTVHSPVTLPRRAAGDRGDALHVPPAAPAVRANDYVLYTINEWNNRKGIDDLLTVYFDTFTADDDVYLYVKTFGDVGEAEGRAFLERLRHGRPSPPRVALVYDEFSTAQIAALHRHGDCYVSLTKAEGLGYGLAEAALWGNPVVCGGFGAQTEYLRGCSFLPYTLEPANFCSRFAAHHAACGPRCRHQPVYDPVTQRWGRPDAAAAAQMLRHFYNTKKTAGNPYTREYIDRNFNPRSVGAAYVTSLRDAIRGGDEDQHDTTSFDGS